ncbi:hypothetical protein [Serratia fonticola]
MSLTTITLSILIFIQWVTIKSMNRNLRHAQREIHELGSRYTKLIDECEQFYRVLHETRGGVIKRYFEVNELIKTLSDISDEKIRQDSLFKLEIIESHLLKILELASKESNTVRLSHTHRELMKLFVDQKKTKTPLFEIKGEGM